MKIKLIFFLTLFSYQLFSMESPLPKIENFKWATISSIRTLEFMKHTKLHRLVPRGILMQKYGLPIVSGSSISTAFFDQNNLSSLSGNLVTTFGGFLDLMSLANLCAKALQKQKLLNFTPSH